MVFTRNNLQIKVEKNIENKIRNSFYQVCTVETKPSKRIKNDNKMQ